MMPPIRKHRFRDGQHVGWLDGRHAFGWIGGARAGGEDAAGAARQVGADNALASRITPWPEATRIARPKEVDRGRALADGDMERAAINTNHHCGTAEQRGEPVDGESGAERQYIWLGGGNRGQLSAFGGAASEDNLPARLAQPLNQADPVLAQPVFGRAASTGMDDDELCIRRDMLLAPCVGPLLRSGCRREAQRPRRRFGAGESCHEVERLLSYVLAGIVGQCFAEQRLAERVSKADPAGNAGQQGERRAPPMVIAHHERRIVALLAQPPCRAQQEGIRRERHGFGGGAIEGGEGQRFERVEVGQTLPHHGSPRPDQRRKVRCGQCFPQRGQRRRRQQQITEMIGFDDQHPLRRINRRAARQWASDGGDDGDNDTVFRIITHLLHGPIGAIVRQPLDWRVSLPRQPAR